jgi:hypothetical protein
LRTVSKVTDDPELRLLPRAVSERNTTHDLLWAALLAPPASQAARTALLDTASLVANNGWVPTSALPDAEGSLESTALFLVLAERCVTSSRFVLQEAVPERGVAQLCLLLRTAAKALTAFALSARGFKPLAEPYVSRRNGRCPTELYALVLAALGAVRRLITHDPTDVDSHLSYPSVELVQRSEQRVTQGLQRSMAYGAPQAVTAAHLVFFVDPSVLPEELHRDVPRTLRTSALAPHLFADIHGRLWLFELEVAARACEMLSLVGEAARLRSHLLEVAAPNQAAWLGLGTDVAFGPHLLTAGAATAARHRLRSE